MTYSADGSGAAGAAVAIVAVGETPYAEAAGDRSDLSLSAEDLALIDRVAAAGTPIVLIVVSGRPLIVGPALDKASAVVAAWLPGTEGRGVSDVLFGDHPPTGKLAFTWARSMDQLPPGEARSREALFPAGFGLTYAKS